MKTIKHCKICAQEFVNISRYEKNYCSRSCASKSAWLKEEYRNNQITKQKETHSTPEYRKKAKDTITELRKNPEYREKMKACHNTPEFKEKMSRIAKTNWLSDSYANAINSSKIGRTHTQETKNIIGVQSKKRWEDKDYKKNFIDKIKMHWIDINSNMKPRFLWYKTKDYILPSGKVVKIQGYENKALDILIKDFDEHDIILSNIYNYTGALLYIYNNKTHKYYPDIYIKSLNKIIEVKSNYTYNLDKEKNLLKRECCINAGLDFEFMIF